MVVASIVTTRAHMSSAPMTTHMARAHLPCRHDHPPMGVRYFSMPPLIISHLSGSKFYGHQLTLAGTMTGCQKLAHVCAPGAPRQRTSCVGSQTSRWRLHAPYKRVMTACPPTSSPRAGQSSAPEYPQPMQRCQAHSAPQKDTSPSPWLKCMSPTLSLPPSTKTGRYTCSHNTYASQRLRS